VLLFCFTPFSCNTSNWAAIPGQVTSRLDDLVKKNLRLSGQRIDINAVAQQVCSKYNISLGELRSGSRRRVVVEARGSISWIAVRELGYSGANVARYLGVTNSCVTRYVASGKKPDVADLIKKLCMSLISLEFHLKQRYSQMIAVNASAHKSDN
jgi:hypothetical protein